MNIQNLQQKNDTLLTVKQRVVETNLHHDPIEFITKSIEPSLCDYSDAYILVTGDITVTGGNANTKTTFKNCAPIKECRTEIDDSHVDEVHFINIAMPM